MGVDERPDTTIIPAQINLRLYPNPVKPDLHVQFDLSRADQIHISIFDVLGRQIFVSPRMTFASGFHNTTLSGFSS
ncbi:MAG: T9SS type A sorting domain-containing protein [bacterium]